MKHLATIGLAVIALALGQASRVRADLIPYPTPGLENPVTYTFTALSTGDIIAYFAGSGALFDNVLGMEVNGVLTGNGFGLDNHSSSVGDSFDLGAATIGDTLTFVMHNITPGLGDLYSDPTLNGPYDGGPSQNHIYSTPYTATSPVFPGVPAGTYVGFEDLRAFGPPNGPPDWNYFDETFVFTNVATSESVPLPSTAWGVIVLLGCVAARRVVRRQPA